MPGTVVHSANTQTWYLVLFGYRVHHGGVQWGLLYWASVHTRRIRREPCPDAKLNSLKPDGLVIGTGVLPINPPRALSRKQ